MRALGLRACLGPSAADLSIAVAVSQEAAVGHRGVVGAALTTPPKIYTPRAKRTSGLIRSRVHGGVKVMLSVTFLIAGSALTIS